MATCGDSSLGRIDMCMGNGGCSMCWGMAPGGSVAPPVGCIDKSAASSSACSQLQLIPASTTDFTNSCGQEKQGCVQFLPNQPSCKFMVGCDFQNKLALNAKCYICDNTCQLAMVNGDKTASFKCLTDSVIQHGPNQDVWWWKFLFWAVPLLVMILFIGLGVFAWNYFKKDRIRNTAKSRRKSIISMLPLKAPNFRRFSQLARGQGINPDIESPEAAVTNGRMRGPRDAAFKSYANIVNDMKEENNVAGSPIKPRGKALPTRPMSQLFSNASNRMSQIFGNNNNGQQNSSNKRLSTAQSKKGGETNKRLSTATFLNSLRSKTHDDTILEENEMENDVGNSSRNQRGPQKKPSDDDDESVSTVGGSKSDVGSAVGSSVTSGAPKSAMRKASAASVVTPRPGAPNPSTKPGGPRTAPPNVALGSGAKVIQVTAGGPKVVQGNDGPTIQFARGQSSRQNSRG